MLDPGHIVADQIAKIALAGHKTDDRHRPLRLARLHQLRKFLTFRLNEIDVARMAGQPQDQFVEEQDQPVVAE